MNQTSVLNPGEILHSVYKIEKILGQGGFGITYLAFDTALRRKVAIKEFFPNELCGRDKTTSKVTVGSENARETVNLLKKRFLREAQHIAQFDNPGIIRIHAVFSENDTAYYVMDCIDGMSLQEIIKTRGPLPLPEALRYTHALGEALEYIHARRVNHYDVKPANILVRSADDTPVLIDFGLSKKYDANGQQTSIGMMGVSHGYAPLEQYGEGDTTSFSPVSDLYSLAATLYCMLTGEKPPRATDIIDQGLTFPPSFPEAIIGPISKAMSPARQNRQQSVRAFLDELPGATDLGKTDIDEETEIMVTTKSIPASPKENVGMQELLPTKQATDKNKIFKWIAIGSLVLAAIGGVIFWINNDNKNNLDNAKDSDVAASPIDSTTNTSSFDPVIQNLIDNMVSVEGGSFMMGSDDPESEAAERPAHRVKVEPFSIGRFEVTQKEWKKVMGSNPSTNIGDHLPVDNVSYYECQEFINKLNSMTGMNFRLPDEEEWEYAARGGNKSNGFRYSGSEDASDVAWHEGNSDKNTRQVGTKSHNELGLYDMSGNVWELTSSNYTSSYGAKPTIDITRRGGAMSSPMKNCRVTLRDDVHKDEKYKNQGLRLSL